MTSPQVVQVMRPLRTTVIRIRRNVHGCDTSGNCPDNYKIERTWKATDRCGNVSTTCKQTITIEDTTPPVVTCPAGITIECSDDFTPVEQDMLPLRTTVIRIQRRRSQMRHFQATVPDNYKIERTWKATDRCGNVVRPVSKP
ncbi:MAG: hypothetical protein IPJ06_05210 [Saprospiraceae bacterium]|nr:hypothetical protein [Saprospiraceae bacterium]